MRRAIVFAGITVLVSALAPVLAPAAGAKTTVAFQAEFKYTVGIACRAQKPRIGPVTRSFIKFARPAPPPGATMRDPDCPPGETPVS
jgi:hypothetical protein